MEQTMNKTIFINKKPIIFTIFLTVIFLCSLLLSTSYSINIVIDFTEKVIHRTLRDHTKWINILKGVVHIPLLASILIFFLNYTELGNKIAVEISKTSKKLIDEIKQKKYLYLFIALTLFFTFAFYKVLDADILFADDISRSHDGDRNWISFGRFISEFLSILIHSTIKLTDIAPLTQFISILIMSITIILLQIILNSKESVTFLKALPLSFLFLSPFFLQCFCYRFDSPYMTLSVLFPVIPFVFKDDLKSYSFMSFVMLILCCMSYQAGQSIYILIVIYISLYKIISGDNLKQIFNFIVVSIISYAISLLVYEGLFAANTNRSDEEYYYSTTFSLSAIINNLHAYLSYVITYTGGLLLKISIILSLFLSYITVYMKAKINKFLALIIYSISLIIAFCLSMGPYILFQQTLLAGRTIMGFNFLITLILYTTFSFQFEKIGEKKYYIPFIATVILCVYSSISFLYTYGNALKTQKEYNNFRYSKLFNDLSNLVDTKETPYISFGGNIGYCNALETVIKNYPIEYIPKNPSENSIWNIDYSYRFNFMFEDEFFDEKPDWPLLLSNYYQDIYGLNNHFYISLKNHSYE